MPAWRVSRINTCDSDDYHYVKNAHNAQNAKKEKNSLRISLALFFKPYTSLTLETLKMKIVVFTNSVYTEIDN